MVIVINYNHYFLGGRGGINIINDYLLLYTYNMNAINRFCIITTNNKLAISKCKEKSEKELVKEIITILKT